jgi:hypothetical protein
MIPFTSQTPAAKRVNPQAVATRFALEEEIDQLVASRQLHGLIPAEDEVKIMKGK